MIGFQAVTVLFLLSLTAVGDAMSPSNQARSQTVQSSTSSSTTTTPTPRGFSISNNDNDDVSRLSSTSRSDRRLLHHRRAVKPPFPNGPCGGTIVEFSPGEIFGVDVNLGNINLLGDLVLKPRPVRVWLPPGYDDDVAQKTRRHPVLYVHDGQNVMTDSESWTGKSWRLMGALTRLADSGLLFSSNKEVGQYNDIVDVGKAQSQALPIIVLIPSAEGDLAMFRRRHLEYGDINFPFAQAHADLVAKTIKPMIDNRFKTNPNADNTFAMGASLGGQASLHLLLRYPDLFGGAACLSPAFGPQIINAVSNIGMTQSSTLRNKKIYIDIGGDFGDIKVPFLDVFDHLSDGNHLNPGYFWLDTQLQPQAMTMKEELSNPSVGANVCFRQYPGGRHNERAWSERIDKPLIHLFS